MTVKTYLDTSEEVREFYYYLGLLSTKFAALENNVLEILGLLITDNFVLTNTILERNSLAQNIELLKKINRYRKFEEKTLNEIVERISNVKTNRNLFIHGIWSRPENKDNDLLISCKEPKIVYSEDEDRQTWSAGRYHTFRLSYIIKQIEFIEEILHGQIILIKKLKEVDDFGKS